MKARPDDVVIENLKVLCRESDGITEFIKATKLRFGTMKDGTAFEFILSGKSEEQYKTFTCPQCKEIVKVMSTKKYQGLESIKGQIQRCILKELKCFPIWMEWAEKVPGIGPIFAGNLILFYYFKFIPICIDCGGDLIKTPTDNGDRKTYICSACGKKAKGEGTLIYRVAEKDFPKISSWWHYMGQHIINGKKAPRQAGVTCDWNPKGKTLVHLIGSQFNRRPINEPYKAFLEKEREKIRRKHPELTKLHNLRRAQSHTAKLFLAHWWQVARTLDELPVTEPYAKTILGHTGIIDPFYWKPEIEQVSVNRIKHSHTNQMSAGDVI